jgi:hypothetical protein
MKKTLLFIILAALAFAAPASAGDGGSFTTVVERLTHTSRGELRPRIEASDKVEVWITTDMVSIRATSNDPVSFRVVNLNNGQSEELPSNIFSIYMLPADFSPEYMEIDADGDVTLYGVEAIKW